MFILLLGAFLPKTEAGIIVGKTTVAAVPIIVVCKNFRLSIGYRYWLDLKFSR
jgi:hypothetical protein